MMRQYITTLMISYSKEKLLYKIDSIDENYVSCVCVWLCEIGDGFAKRSKEGRREIPNLRTGLWYCNELFAWAAIL